ncbi:glycosyltransferase family 2 protein [Natronolimnobius sp. AArcel1]|uniref:glycosyltransferase family 2 protein n=1 Tax=Natronolimnobius sp. AArcel1 TaxID=1679093 RepID=UPI0013EA79E2|nr:glycosyltransferase family 2 protein [Natronolimnobius sp. AArcel1]NGM70318.1 glycosyltransferase family 2 protein [Natronolimnobius sp. AArcel1]
MSKTIHDEQARKQRTVSTDVPAVGVVATPANSESIPTAVLQAKRHGFDVIVTAVDDAVSGYQLATELDVRTVEPTESQPQRVDPWDQLTTEARAAGFPGLIAHRDPGCPIDYNQSYRHAIDTDRYMVEAATTPAVEATPQILAAIPAYNEATSIDDVVTGALEHADEVLVVDDGSTDETADIAREAGATVLEHEQNSGYGGSLKTIFREAERAHADHLVILDGDGQHDPADIQTLVETQCECEAELVIGSRFEPESETTFPLYRRAGLFVVNTLTNLGLGIVRPSGWVGDTQSGFRAYDRTAIESLATDNTIGDEMGASTDILHHAHHQSFTIDEVGTTVSYDVDNASSQNPISHGIHLVTNILRTVEEERPISSLGIPGLLSAACGIGFAYLTIANYIDSGTFPLGLALVSIFFTLAGIFACFTSIVLHSLNKHSRRMAETTPVRY